MSPIHKSVSFLVALQLSGCVLQARHADVQKQLAEATEARDAERRKGADLELQVAELEQTLTELRVRVAASDAALEGERETLAEVRFESDVVEREREEAKRMSDQLLIELERVASHLKTFADDKEALARELESARDRLAVLALDERASQARFQTARQLTLALAEPLEKETLRLTLVDGNIALQFPTKAAFAGEGGELSESGRDVLAKAASVLEPLDLSVSVEQPEGAQSRAERARSVSDALVAFGFPSERVIAEEGAAKEETATTDPATDEATSDPEGLEATEDAESSADLEPAAQAANEANNASESDTELELLLHFPSSES